MKILKKLLCAVLCLSLVFAITACDKKEEKKSSDDVKEMKLNKTSKKVAKNSDEEEIEELVCEYLDHTLKMNLEGAMELTNADKDSKEAVEGIDSIEAFCDMMFEANPDISEMSEYIDLNPVKEAFVDKFASGLEECEYEIISIEGEDDEYTVEVSYTMMDQSSMGDAFGNIEEPDDDTMLEWSGLDSMEEFEEMGEEAIILALEGGGEEYIVESLVESIESIEWTAEELEEEITVIEDDGEWIIDVK